MALYHRHILWKVILILLSYTILLCNCIEVTLTDQTGIITDVCSKREQEKNTVYWVSEKKSVLLTGHGSVHSAATFDCSFIIGAATTGSKILQLRFEALYIADCGVALTINQSSNSDFTTDQSLMLNLSCGHGAVGTLHSKPRHYVKVNLHKVENKLSARHNFRINVTVADSLPATGLETHYLIIIAGVMFVVVGVSLGVLVKYLIRRSERWREHRRERNMERAIRLYNNQEAPPESDYMYTAVPYQDMTNTANGQDSHSHQASSRPGRNRSGDIAFVHADGHIETFRMRDNPLDRPSGGNSTPASSHGDAGDENRGVLVIQRGVGLVQRSPAVGNGGSGVGGGLPRVPGAGASDADADTVPETSATVDESGDLPPSYEEALNMPTPLDPESPFYANLDTGNLCKNAEENSKT